MPSIQNHANVLVPRRPGITEKLARLVFKTRRDGVAKPVEGLAQRTAPFLVPAGMAAGITTTILSPTTDAMSATPRTGFTNLSLVRRGMPFEILTVIGDHAWMVRLDVVHRIRQPHVSVPVMMSVCFTIRRDVHDLRPASR